MKKVSVISIMFSMLLYSVAFAGPSIVGSMQGWDPADSTYNLTENANGVWELTKTLDAGDYDYRVVETDAWDGNDFPGSNQSFTLESESDVTWKVNLGATVGVKEGDEYVFHTQNPPVVCGDFLSELGGSDWNAGTTITQMVDDGTGGDETAGDDIYTYQVVIPAGSYQYKIVLNNNWDQSTGPNISFNSNGVDATRFTYDMSNNTTANTSLGAPELTDAQQYSKTKVDVFFNAIMDTSGTSVAANNPSNYTINARLSVSSVDIINAQVMRLNLDEELIANTSYIVTVDTVVQSAMGVPMNPSAVSDSFTSYTYAPITFVVDDSHNQTHPIFYLKGSWDAYGCYDAAWGGGAEHTPFYDDGTHGDTVANDHIFMVTLDLVCDDSTHAWEWGVNDESHVWLDGNWQFWVPNSNPQTLTYVMPYNTSQNVTVTFNVDISDSAAAGFDSLGIYGSVSPFDWDWGTINNHLTEVVPDSLWSGDITFPTSSTRYVDFKFGRNGMDVEAGWGENHSFYIDDSDSTQTVHCVYGIMELILNTPRNVQISIANSDVTISWDAVTDATDYEVLRSSDPYSEFEHLANTGGATNYTDSGAGGKYRADKYFYQVKAKK